MNFYTLKKKRKRKRKKEKKYLNNNNEGETKRPGQKLAPNMNLSTSYTCLKLTQLARVETNIID